MSDYNLPDIHASRRILNKNAVPSVNLPGQSIQKQLLAVNRHNRNHDRTEKNKVKFEKKKSKNNCEKSKCNKNISVVQEPNEAVKNSSASSMCESTEINTVDNTGAKNECENEKNYEDQSDEMEHTTYNKHIEKSDDKETEHVSDSCISAEGLVSVDKPLVKSTLHTSESSDVTQELNSKMITSSFVKDIETDAQLSTATGLESFKLLDSIVGAVKIVIGDRFEKQNFVLNTYNRIFLTYVKLKQNCTYSFLGLLFNCISERHCQRIFIEMVQILSKVLSVAIHWPTRQEIETNIPLCFGGFEDVRVVLDCTEIFIERPKNLCCQIITYSHYKHHYTCKFLTGVTPAGDISFISDAYGRKAGDSAIFHQSGFTNLLEPGDAIMVDRGFYIEETCKKNKWKLYRPPDVINKKQFNKSEAVNTASIARARVHVERSNARLKTFGILRSTLPANLIPLAEDIFKLICATINLSSPILKMDKFLNQ